MCRFTHPSFASRTLKQQTVCIVCQRWFCDPKIKNPDPKSKFYNTFQKPECYFRWLGDRADTPEAQAEYLAAPYKSDGGLTNGWRGKAYASCGWCMRVATTLEAQAKNEKAIALSNQRPTNQRCLCVNHKTCDGRVGKAGQFCVKCQASSS